MSNPMLKFLISLAASLVASSSFAQTLKHDVPSPDGKLVVSLDASSGNLLYSVNYDGKTIVSQSRLGLVTSIGSYGTNIDTSAGLAVTAPVQESISYELDRIKSSHVSLPATRSSVSVSSPDGLKLDVDFVVENNAVAFRYQLHGKKSVGCLRVLNELTEFRFPEATTTFLCPQSDAMIGWKRTKPSYEEEYDLDQPMDRTSKYGHGFTFPCLFKVAPDGWALVSETGVSSRYCGSRLGDFVNGAYKIEYPMPEENNGNGTAEPALALPGATPWRTIAIGASAPVVAEQTITWDVVEPQFQPSQAYSYGKGTWSWILWQDRSINYDDQKSYVDFAADMGYQFVLIDNFWDTRIGRDKMEQLASYAASKNVKLVIWYSSSGYWNDIVQSPTNIMDRAISRKAEMAWLKKIGAAGIKVDFFGGDKQETMRLYEDILSDANDYGLTVVFHGTTLPRGWERMYPNYVGSEAVLASENLIFDQHFCDAIAVNTTTHPFIRNAVGSMEFGGSFLNKRMSRDNASGNTRTTTDVFEIAQSVIFQNPVQFFALAPNNLTDAPAVCVDFLKSVPTTWDESRILDGYPGRYVVVARRHGSTWYVAAVNATSSPIKLNLSLPFAQGTQISVYSDGKDGQPILLKSRTAKTAKPTRMTIRPNGGMVFVGE